jgi:hypothetical protein
MIKRISVDLNKKYITKPLHSDTLTKALAENSHHILHRLYLVTNGLKDRQPFMEIEHEKYTVSAHINIQYGYADEAREQASAFKIMKPRVTTTPKFTISFTISERVNMVEVFKFKHVTTSEQEVYNLIKRLEDKIGELV